MQITIVPIDESKDFLPSFTFQTEEEIKPGEIIEVNGVYYALQTILHKTKQTTQLYYTKNGNEFKKKTLKWNEKVYICSIVPRSHFLYKMGSI